MEKTVVLLLIAVTAWACSSTGETEHPPAAAGGPAGKADLPTDSEVGTRFQLALAAIEGKYTSAEDGTTATIDVGRAFAPTPMLMLDTRALGPIAVPLTYDAEHENFIGFLARSCDDPGCSAIQALAVRLRRQWGSYRLSYVLHGVRFAEAGDDGDGPFAEEGLLVAQTSLDPSTTPVLTFGATSRFDTAVQSALVAAYESECDHAVPSTVTDEQAWSEDGDPAFSVEVETDDGRTAYISIVLVDDAYEVIESRCPE
jgi:hypothetical protein